MTPSSRTAWAAGRLAAGVIVAGLLASLCSHQFRLRAQQPAAALAAVDRIAIHQLVNRYSYAIDDAIDDGGMLARLFVPEGVLVTPGGAVSGHAGLAAFARGRRQSTWVATLVTNIVVEGAGSSAAGRVYVVEIHGGDAAGAGTLSTGGVFVDRYVNTSDGWRFARREFTRSSLPQRK